MRAPVALMTFAHFNITLSGILRMNPGRPYEYASPIQIYQVAKDFPKLDIHVAHGGWPSVMDMIGAAEIATADGAARDAYSTRHHESPRYIYGDRRDQPIVPANVANHNDAELIMLETLVGRAPPREFMNSTYRY